MSVKKIDKEDLPLRESIRTDRFWDRIGYRSDFPKSSIIKRHLGKFLGKSFDEFWSHFHKKYPDYHLNDFKVWNFCPKLTKHNGEFYDSKKEKIRWWSRIFYYYESDDDQKIIKKIPENYFKSRKTKKAYTNTKKYSIGDEEYTYQQVSDDDQIFYKIKWRLKKLRIGEYSPHQFMLEEVKPGGFLSVYHRVTWKMISKKQLSKREIKKLGLRA